METVDASRTVGLGESALQGRYFVTMNNTVNTNDQPNSPPVEYDPQAVEMKWQDRWRERGTNATDIPGARDPYYALMMFPYPSAEGLHVGNLFAFVGNDIYGRFRRCQGQTVCEAMCYAATGTPVCAWR